jgi:hypothetical protein
MCYVLVISILKWCQSICFGDLYLKVVSEHALCFGDLYLKVVSEHVLCFGDLYHKVVSEQCYVLVIFILKWCQSSAMFW